MPLVDTPQQLQKFYEVMPDAIGLTQGNFAPGGFFYYPLEFFCAFP
jgi:hypothetical protein